MDPFATSLYASIKTAYSLQQFMYNDFSVKISKIHAKAANYFNSTGEYEHAKQSLVTAYLEAAEKKFLKVLNHDRLYRLALAVAVCYQATGQTPDLTKANKRYENIVEDWKNKANCHLDELKEKYEGMAYMTPISSTGNPIYNYTASESGLKEVAQEREDLPKVLAGIKKLKFG